MYLTISLAVNIQFSLHRPLESTREIIVINSIIDFPLRRPILQGDPNQTSIFQIDHTLTKETFMTQI